jgi:hypothetical protein
MWMVVGYEGWFFGGQGLRENCWLSGEGVEGADESDLGERPLNDLSPYAAVFAFGDRLFPRWNLVAE